MSYTTIEERQREKIIELQARVAELEGARAKACEGAAPEYLQHETAAVMEAASIPATGRSAQLCALLNELSRRSLVIAKQAHELERLQAEHRELSDQFITNAQRLGSVCDNWHNWAVEIVGKEAARKMSGQDMRDEILRRLAELDRVTTVQTEQDCGEGTPR